MASTFIKADNGNGGLILSSFFSQTILFVKTGDLEQLFKCAEQKLNYYYYNFFFLLLPNHSEGNYFSTRGNVAFYGNNRHYMYVYMTSKRTGTRPSPP